MGGVSSIQFFFFFFFFFNVAKPLKVPEYKIHTSALQHDKKPGPSGGGPCNFNEYLHQCGNYSRLRCSLRG